MANVLGTLQFTPHFTIDCMTAPGRIVDMTSHRTSPSHHTINTPAESSRARVLDQMETTVEIAVVKGIRRTKLFNCSDN